MEKQFVIVNSKACACKANHSKIINSQSKHPNALKDKIMNVKGRNMFNLSILIELLKDDYNIFHTSPMSKTYCGLILNNQQVAVDPYVFITILTLIVY